MNTDFPSALRKDGYQISSQQVREGFEKVYASALGDLALHRDYSMKKVLGDHAQIARTALLLKDLGIMRSQLEYGTPANGMSPGRHYHTELLVRRADALPVLERALIYLEEQKLARRKAAAKTRATRRWTRPTVETAPDDVRVNGYETKPHHPGLSVDTIDIDTGAVTLAKNDEEEVRAVAGPEPTSPFRALQPLRRDEAQALVEAADQYLNRSTVLAEQFEKLREAAAALGITIDLETVMSGAQFNRDERLEHVALVVPYIKGLGTTIERLTRERAEYRAKAEDYDKVKRERDRLSERLRDLTSARVLASQQASARA